MADTKQQLVIQEQVEQAYSVLSGVPDAAALASRAGRLLERLRAEEKLVAVFGAFSAGKSSLINALTGEAGLAVSPNPTTATVSRLAYASNGREHAVIYAKTAEQLLEDVRAAWSVLQAPVADLAEASERAKALKMAGWSPRQRRSVSFLRAFADGYEVMASRLGQRFEATLDEVAMYTAEERIACFIDRVDILRHEALFQHGLSLVDTPGVDSIHRRHTDVAFRYMQEADAIVFVLYYTHAFSRADKDFVMQLSGVQDVAGEDKLFVVLNAVDLASSEDERIAVETRVREELRRCGIPKPRIYPVSSQLGYAAKKLLGGDITPEIEAMVRHRLNLAETAPLPDGRALLEQSGLHRLSSDLSQFTEERFDDLARTSVQRLLSETARTADERLQGIANRLAQSDDAKARLVADRAKWKHELGLKLQDATTGKLDVAQSLEGDWNELLFHAGERIRIRLGGLVREAYHPGRFRNESKAKESLADAADELTAMLERQIELEVRTLWLRMRKGAERGLAALEATCKDTLQRIHVPTLMTAWAVPMHAEETWQAHLDGDILQSGAKYFRSAKQFFEGGGQTAFQQAVEDEVMLAVRAEMSRIEAMEQAQVLEALAEGAVTGFEQALSLIEAAEKEAFLSTGTLTTLREDWEQIRKVVAN